MYAVRHYVLRWQFTLFTDHAPLQWLLAQKMEEMLCCWALAMQEYSFHVVYQNRSSNANADALSRISSLPCSAALTLHHFSTTDLLTAQGSDKVIVEVVSAHSKNDSPPRTPEWHQYPLRRYTQM